MKYIIVGVGGIGTHLANLITPMLNATAPGATLVLVDGDSFEPSNLERQAFDGTWGNKAQVKAAELSRRYPEVVVLPLPKWVVSDVGDDEDSDGKITPNKLLEDSDVVYAVVDNFAARSLLLNAARDLANVDVLVGGNDDALFGTAYHYQRRNGAEITEHPSVFHSEYVDPPDRNPGEMSCQERSALPSGGQTIVANAQVALLLAAATLSSILPSSEPAVTEVIFDLAGTDIRMRGFDRRAALYPENQQGEPTHA